MKLKNTHIKNSDLIYKARNFAFEAHALERQRYGEHAYSKHLSDVFLFLISMGYSEPEYLVTALLHDVLEDTYVSRSEIENLFGNDILNNVLALTKLQNGEPNYILLKNSKVARAVKISDSICNISQGLIERNSKSAKYIKRFSIYREKLYIKGEFENLWLALEDRINIYKLLVLV